MDTVAEWLRRRPAKPLGSARVGSNPIGVVEYFQASPHLIIPLKHTPPIVIKPLTLRVGASRSVRLK